MNPLDEPLYNMEYSPAHPWPTILKYGLIGGGSLVLLNACIFLLSGHLNIFSSSSAMTVGNLLALILYVLIIVFSLLEYRDQLSRGYLMIRKGILVSFGSVIIMGLMSLIFSIFYLLVLDPEYIGRMMYRDYGEDRAAMLTDAAAIINAETVIVYQLLSFILGCIIGIFISLIISAIMKKDPPFNARYQY